MKIVLAKAAGFCMGVKRAMDIVLDQANRRESVVTHGPLIHNPQVIEVLRERGIGVLGKNPGPSTGETVVVRAHGITPNEHEELCRLGYNVVDATCPHVIRIQKLIDRHVAKNDAIIIVGDHGHAEAKGLLGHTKGRGYVVAGREDVAALPDLGPQVCVVSQTTQSFELFDDLVAQIRTRWSDCAVYRTICGATDKRQQETVSIARQVDAMVIVGGKGSANTVRLAELAAETGTPTYHIETADELDCTQLEGKETIGVTAGASTPNWMLLEATERLEEHFRHKWNPLSRTGFGFLNFLLDTNLYLALGALAMGYGCAMLQGISVPLQALLAASFYIFGMYALNIQSRSRPERYSNPLRGSFYKQWGSVLIALGYASLGISLTLSAFLGVWAFSLMLLANTAGVVYRLPLIPVKWADALLHHHRRLIDIPGSKDIFMGLAWAVVLTLLPLEHFPEGGDQAIRIVLTFFYVFTLVFIRSVVFDLRDIQGDQIMGRETIPMVLGKNRTKKLLALLTGLLFLAMLMAAVTGVVTSLGYVLILPVLYTWGYLYLYHRRSIMRGTLFEAMLGGKFILVGVLAALWRVLV